MGSRLKVEMLRIKLNTQHGEEEAQVLIDKGWFKTVQRGGVTMYVRIDESERMDLTHTHSHQLERTAMIWINKITP